MSEIKEASEENAGFCVLYGEDDDEGSEAMHEIHDGELCPMLRFPNRSFTPEGSQNKMILNKK